MNVKELLKRAREFGCEFQLVNGNLKMRAPSGGDIIKADLHEHSSEIRHEIFKEQYDLVFGISGCPEENYRLTELLEERGYVLTWCDELQDPVAFHRDDIDTSVIPEVFVKYSESEIGVIGNEDMKRLRTVHHAKKIGEGNITRLVKTLI